MSPCKPGLTASHNVSGSGSERWEKVQAKPPPADPSDNKPLSDRAEEPKAETRKWDPTPDLVILEDDDSTPLPRKSKGVGKKTRTQNPDEEAMEALSSI